MKDSLAILLCLSLFLFSCSSSDSDMPKIKIVGVYLDGDETTNYWNKLDRLPLLNIGDKVDVEFYLDGNGNDLRTFLVQSEFPNNIKTTLFFDEDEVSKEFSELSEGKLVFIDNIPTTELSVQAEVRAISKEEVALSFYLFSKAPDSEGASVEIKLKTGIPEEPKE